MNIPILIVIELILGILAATVFWQIDEQAPTFGGPRGTRNLIFAVCGVLVLGLTFLTGAVIPYLGVPTELGCPVAAIVFFVGSYAGDRYWRKKLGVPEWL